MKLVWRYQQRYKYLKILFNNSHKDKDITKYYVQYVKIISEKKPQFILLEKNYNRKFIYAYVKYCEIEKCPFHDNDMSQLYFNTALDIVPLTVQQSLIN